jgi:hypothetical protein
LHPERLAAARILKNIGDEGLDLPALLGLLQDSVAEIRKTAVTLLAAHAEHAGAVSALLRARNDSAAPVSYLAHQQLALMAPKLRKKLLADLLKDPSAEVREWAVTSATRKEPAQRDIADVLAAALHDAVPSIRSMVLRWLVKQAYDSNQARETLIDTIRYHGIVEVRREALRSLADADLVHKKVVDAAHSIAADPQNEVRDTARDVLPQLEAARERTIAAERAAAAHRHAEAKPAAAPAGYRCCRCGKSGDPLQVSAKKKVVLTNSLALSLMIAECKRCARRFCGTCVQRHFQEHSPLDAEVDSPLSDTGSAFVLLCPDCGGPLGSVQGVPPGQATRLRSDESMTAADTVATCSLCRRPLIESEVKIFPWLDMQSLGSCFPKLVPAPRGSLAEGCWTFCAACDEKVRQLHHRLRDGLLHPLEAETALDRMADVSTRCTLCARLLAENQVEQVSYHDIRDLEDGIVYAGPPAPYGKRDLKKLFPEFSWSRAGDYLSNWPVCAACHKKVRQILGGSEFEPRHY